VSAGLVQFCLSVLCLFEAVSDASASLDALRAIRSDVIEKSRTGRQYLDLLDRHTPDLVAALASNGKLRERAARALDEVVSAPGGKISSETVAEVTRLLDEVAARPQTGKPLADALRKVRADLPTFADRTLSEALATLDK